MKIAQSFILKIFDYNFQEYKTSIADTIITIIEENPEAKESGLAHLCEFIEDCEHTSLAVRILHLLGEIKLQYFFTTVLREENLTVIKANYFIV